MRSDILNEYSKYNQAALNQIYNEAITDFKHKIIVLDDDPTGTQKVHGIHVYTNWEEASILDGFQSNNQMFFILTNSRSFTQGKKQSRFIKKSPKELNVLLMN